MTGYNTPVRITGFSSHYDAHWNHEYSTLELDNEVTLTLVNEEELLRLQALLINKLTTEAVEYYTTYKGERQND